MSHPYGARYQRERAALLAGRPRCHCGASATSADHVPPLKLHSHIDGSGCCVLRPACKPCQDRQGANIVNGRVRSPLPPPSRAWA